MGAVPSEETREPSEIIVLSEHSSSDARLSVAVPCTSLKATASHVGKDRGEQLCGLLPKFMEAQVGSLRPSCVPMVTLVPKLSVGGVQAFTWATRAVSHRDIAL